MFNKNNTKSTCLIEHEHEQEQEQDTLIAIIVCRIILANHHLQVPLLHVHGLKSNHCGGWGGCGCDLPVHWGEMNYNYWSRKHGLSEHTGVEKGQLLG